MARTETIRKADAIFCADLHLRDDVPECRTDDYRVAMWKKVDWLAGLQRQHSCPVIDAGDMFNRWHVSAELEGQALLHLPDGMVTVPGNHDLPQHNLKMFAKSSLHVLEAAGKVRVLKTDSGNRIHSPDVYSFPFADSAVHVMGFPYGEQPRGLVNDLGRRKIAVIHAYVAEDVPAFIADGWTPAQLLAALPGYDVIVSGHNHTPLVYEHRGRLVVNPGSMMRATADQADYQPRVYLWYADTNTVEAAYFPVETGVVSRAHIDSREERDSRMQAFVESLDADVEIGLSFGHNVEAFLANPKNKVRPVVKDIVRRMTGADK